MKLNVTGYPEFVCKKKTDILIKNIYSLISQSGDQVATPQPDGENILKKSGPKVEWVCLPAFITTRMSVFTCFYHN